MTRAKRQPAASPPHPPIRTRHLPTPPMPRARFISLQKKLEIAQYALACGNIHATARAFPWASRYQIRTWIRSRSQIAEKIAKNPRAYTLHPGAAPKDLALESTVLQWLKAQRAQGFAVSVNDVIIKSLTVEPQFKGECMIALRSWAHRLLRRHRLSIRRRTRVAQHLPADAEATKARYSNRIMKSLAIRAVEKSMFVNMDQTPLWFDAIPTTTIEETGARTVFIRSGASSNQRATLAISVAFDGTKLPLFIVFKGKSDGYIARRLQRTRLPEGIIAVVQENAWMDSRVLDVWFEKVYRPYAESVGNAVLLLDKYKCHSGQEFVDKARAIGSHVRIIPGGHTSVLQPLDVGVNRPFKCRYYSACQRWKIGAYQRQGGSGPMPIPDRNQVIDWLAEIWASFPTEIVQSSFRGSGFKYDANRSVETESESDS